MTLYDEMQQLTREILADPDFKQGETQLVQLTPGTGPIDDPGAPTRTLYNLNATARGVKFSYVAGGLAVASDLQVTHSVIPGVTPKMTDFVIADGVTYKIVAIIPKPAFGTTVSFTLIVRK
ncbi:hypothetical protein HUU40_00120 [candidate division KSB1 bacterium]|nr:hypothetical protein [candidate division KSB1 bacterium]